MYAACRQSLCLLRVGAGPYFIVWTISVPCVVVWDEGRHGTGFVRPSQHHNHKPRKGQQSAHRLGHSPINLNESGAQQGLTLSDFGRRR